MTGVQGATGVTGQTGMTGKPGVTGHQGPVGPAGVPGVQGTPGAIGPTGPIQYKGFLYFQAIPGTYSSSGIVNLTPIFGSNDMVTLLGDTVVCNGGGRYLVYVNYLFTFQPLVEIENLMTITPVNNGTTATYNPPSLTCILLNMPGGGYVWQGAGAFIADTFAGQAKFFFTLTNSAGQAFQMPTPMLFTAYFLDSNGAGP